MSQTMSPTPASARLGRKLAEYRSRAGLPVRELAAAANVSPQTITNLEGGTLVPGRDSVLRMLEKLDLDDISQRRFMDLYVDTRVETTTPLGQLPLLMLVDPDEDADRRIVAILELGLDAYESLVAGVIAQAISDARYGQSSVREEARAFLADPYCRDLLVHLGPSHMSVDALLASA